MAVCLRAWKCRKKIETQIDPNGDARIRYQGLVADTGRAVEFWYNFDTGIVETAYPLLGRQ
jgi:hypothetical protein